jgi:hypothetical protein
LRTVSIKEYIVRFDTLSSGLCQASVTDNTNSLPIYLLFEPEKIAEIETKLKAVPFKGELTLEFFKMVVAGCIKNCMRY